jgi:hypothetical protein
LVALHEFVSVKNTLPALVTRPNTISIRLYISVTAEGMPPVDAVHELNASLTSGLFVAQ